jgi:outer membrane autotransporter protein
VRPLSLFRTIFPIFVFCQTCFFSGPAMGRPPDPLILPAGEIQAVLSADGVNQELINQGRATGTTLPFTSGTTVYEMRTTRDIYMVRTYLRDPSRLKDGAVGSWLMNPNALRGISPAQVKDLFALPALNDYLTTVKVPAGTIIRIGSAGPIVGWGDGGGEQILLVTRLSLNNYQQQRTLVDQNLLFFPLARGGNPGAVAAYLDNLPQAEPFNDWSVVSLLLGYLTPGTLPQALTQIGPERYDTLTQLDIQNTVLFTNALMERRRIRMMDSPSKYVKAVQTAVTPFPGSGSSASFEMNQDGLSFWGEGVGAFGRQNSSRDHVGFQYQTGSFLAGADKRIKESFLLGGGIGLSRTSFSWNDSLGDGNISQVNLGLYGMVPLDPFFVDGALTGGIRKADITRRISFSGVDRLAASSPDGYNLAASLNSGLNKRINGWEFQPMARMDLIYISQNALSESGADSLNLRVDGYNTWTWRGELGVRLARTFSSQSGLRVTPELWLGGGYLAPLDNRELKASLSGQPGSFTVNGYSNSSTSFLPRLGITAQGWGRTSFFLRYEGDYRSDFMGHNINGGIQVPF